MKRKSNPHRLHHRRTKGHEAVSQKTESVVSQMKKLAAAGDEQAEKALEYLEYLTPEPYHKTMDVKTPGPKSVHTCNINTMKVKSVMKSTVQLKCVCGKLFDVSKQTFAIVKDKKKTTGSVSIRPASRVKDPSTPPISSAS